MDPVLRAKHLKPLNPGAPHRALRSNPLSNHAHVQKSSPGTTEAFLASVKLSTKLVAIGVSAPVLIPLGLVVAGGHALFEGKASVFTADLGRFLTPVRSIGEDAAVIKLYLQSIGSACKPRAEVQPEIPVTEIKPQTVPRNTEKQKFLAELDRAIEELKKANTRAELSRQQQRVEAACAAYCGSDQKRVLELFQDPEIRKKFALFSKTVKGCASKIERAPGQFQTQQARMMISWYAQPEKIAEGRFTTDELSMKVSNPQVHLKVLAMMRDYGVVEKIPPGFFTSSTTVADVINKIVELKPEGLAVPTALNYMATSLETANKTLNDPLIAAFHSRVREQATDQRAARHSLATEIMKRTETPEYKDVGVMLHGGWNYTKDGRYTGHYVGVEVRKVGEKYQFVVANAGSGVRGHHEGVSDGRAKTIKIYEVDSKEEAQKIVEGIISLAAMHPSQKTSSSADEFYGLFSKARSLSVNHIPSRPLQKGGNCTIRNQKELMFYILQRNAQEGVANKLQNCFTEQALSQIRSPAIVKELQKQGEKEQILPLYKVYAKVGGVSAARRKMQKQLVFAERARVREAPKGFQVDGTLMLAGEGKIKDKHRAITSACQTERVTLATCEVGVANTIGVRPSMEDEHLAVNMSFTVAGVSHSAQLLGVFDGHGGRVVAAKVKAELEQRLKAILEKQPSLTDESIANALTAVCIEMGDDFKNDKAGTCATIAFIHRGFVYTANVGDSRAIQIRPGGTALQLTEDAKPEPANRWGKGVNKRGGFVGGGRVWGENSGLAVAREIGRQDIQGVIARPKITKIPFQNTLCIACDGLWDVATSGEAAKAIHTLQVSGKNPEEIAKAITLSAVGKGSNDNITCMIVRPKF